MRLIIFGSGKGVRAGLALEVRFALCPLRRGKKTPTRTEVPRRSKNPRDEVCVLSRGFSRVLFGPVQCCFCQFDIC